MLIAYKSAASADLITFEKNAQDMLEALGKGRSEGKGIFTVAQLPDAIARLRKAIAEDPARPAAPPEEAAAEDSPEEGASFHQRAVPLLEMLERALHEGVPVTWGV